MLLWSVFCVLFWQPTATFKPEYGMAAWDEHHIQ